MEIAIISDIHDNIPNLTKVLGYCRENKIEKIICCGDLASLETLDYLNDNFSGEIFFVFGNMDNDYLKNKFCHPELACPPNGRDSGSRFRIKSGMTCEYKNTRIFKDFGEIEIEKKKVAFIHFPQEAKALCETGKYAFVFHGHTHKPWTEIINKCTLLNPGNVANQYYPPTFAVWNTNNNAFELIRINELL